MSYILVGILIAILLVLWFSTRRKAGTPAPPRRATPTASQPLQTPSTQPPADQAAAAVPTALLAFARIRHETLSPAARDALLSRLRTIPRPPKALHQLVSPEFLSTATSTALSDIVMGESLIAAKVLATVNSPAYNLQNPVLSMGQAITFLGMNTVRAICLRYLLDDAFRAPTATGATPFQPIWNASSLGSELCFRVAQHWRLPEAGALSTQVVLSFLGHLAARSLSPEGQAALASDFLQRSVREQQDLGLSAVEIGAMLMADWGLPAALVQEIRQIDLTLDAPAATTAAQPTVVALAYTCARLGEQLALDPNFDLAAFTPALDDPTWYHAQRTLGTDGMQRLQTTLRTPAVTGAVLTMAKHLPR